MRLNRDTYHESYDKLLDEEKESVVVSSFYTIIVC